jgi:hypothetical protein
MLRQRIALPAWVQVVGRDVNCEPRSVAPFQDPVIRRGSVWKPARESVSFLQE